MSEERLLDAHETEGLPESTHKGGQRRVLAFMFAHWRYFALFGDENALDKAKQAALLAFEHTPGSVWLCLAAVFMNLQSEDVETAQGLLDNISPYRNYYKNNDPAVFLVWNYLQACAFNAAGKPKAAQKHYKAIDESAAVRLGGLKESLQAGLLLDIGRPLDAFALLEESFRLGGRSTFMFVNVGRFLGEKCELEGFRELLVRFTAWGAALGPQAEKMVEIVLERYEENMSFYYFDDDMLAIYKRIARANPRPWLLRGICHSLIEKGDDSPQALEFFESAQRKQIEVEGLNAALIKAAYKNGMGGLSHYAVSRFLLADAKAKLTDAGLKAFLYHAALCDMRFKDVVAALDDDITAFAFRCLEDGMRGRHVNSIFAHALLSLERRGVDEPGLQPLVAGMEDQLYTWLFTYELRVENPGVSQVWPVEEEKSRQALYSKSENGWVVRAASGQAVAICFSETEMRVMEPEEAPVTFIRLTENAGLELYMYFYRRGRFSTELLIALARHIIAPEKAAGPEDSGENQSGDEWIGVLSETLARPDVSRGFKMQVSAALGNILFDLNDRDKALAYYSAVDVSYLNDRHIEQMLRVFLGAGEWERAARLVSKKSHCIQDRTLFYALKRLVAQEELRPLIANAAYELILNSWHDKALLDAVLAHYKGSQEEWQELSRALAIMSASEEGLDEIIIRNSVWMHKFDAGTQKVYARMFENSPDNGHIGLFTYYCAYEILINNVKPEYDTIATMEKIFLKTPDLLLALALCAVYFEHSVATLHSEGILIDTLKLMQEHDILLPIFKNLDIDKLNLGGGKDNSAAIAYIVKNLPFIYRCQPGKNVAVYYKTDDEAEFNKRMMKYLRFGLYTAKVTHFYAEKTTYYFSEEMPTGSIVTKQYETANKMLYITDSRDELAKDPFFTINNALAYEQMFKYEQVEAIITETLKENHNVRGDIL